MGCKNVVITGGGSGIGFALAKASAQREYQVIILDKEPVAPSHIAQELPEADYLSVDVSDFASVTDAAQNIFSRYQTVDLVFNNAGIMIPGKVCEQDAEQFSRVINVNLMGAFHVIRTFVPLMRTQDTPSRIVNTSSLAGLIPSPLFGAYNASKHGVIALSETLDYELKMENDTNVSVSVLAPGPVATPIMQAAKQEALGDETQTLLDYLHANMQDIGLTPEAIAEVTFKAIENGQYWVFPHPEHLPRIATRAQDISEIKDPTFTPW